MKRRVKSAREKILEDLFSIILTFRYTALRE